MNRVDLVDDVQVTLLVDGLVKGARELLHRMDQDLLTLAIHLEALGQRLGLSFNHALACENHVVLDFVRVHIHLTSGLVVSVKDVLVFLVDFL